MDQNQYGKWNVSINQAKEVLSTQDVLGPAEIKKAFDYQLKEEQILPIPFSLSELEEAKKLEQFLVLRINVIGNSKLSNMIRLEKICGPKLKLANKILEDYTPGSISYMHTPPRYGWYLVTKKIIEKSSDGDYLQQTKALIDYLTMEGFNNRSLPLPYINAIIEFEQLEPSIKESMRGDWRNAFRTLAKMQINRWLRRTTVEVLYDFLIYFLNNNVMLLDDIYDLTSDENGYGDIMIAGGKDVDGIIFTSALDHYRSNDNKGRNQYANTGVVFARSF